MTGITSSNPATPEAAANRRKVVALGILLCVGMCFWIPQLSRMMQKPGQYLTPAGNSGVGNDPSGRVTAANIAEVPAAQNGNGSFSWKDLSGWLDQEGLKVSSRPLQAVRNPFGFKEEVAEADVEFQTVRDNQPAVVAEPPPAPKAATPAVLPAPSGLVLKSTLQGKSRRGALINDKYYHEGNTIMVNSEAYEVILVEPRRVILRSGEQHYELLIPSVLPRSEFKPAERGTISPFSL